MFVSSAENTFNRKLLNVTASEHAKIAKLITLIEKNEFNVASFVSTQNAISKPCITIGITGGAGVGKSTFIDKFIFQALIEKKSVAVIAIDPTSKITNGTLFGDRMRFNTDYPSKGVYIRSLASNDSPTGIPAKLRDILAFLKILGFDIILIETVGIGQNDIEIKKYVEKIITIPSHDSDDWIQQFKLGANEISDLYFINKTDKVRFITTKTAIEEYLTIKFPDSIGAPGVLEGSALHNIGVKTAYDEIMLN
jgi:LAO/AO transport system kinase